MIIKLVLEKRSPTPEGKLPLKIRFSNRGKTSYVGLDIFVYPHELDYDAITSFISIRAAIGLMSKVAA